MSGVEFKMRSHGWNNLQGVEGGVGEADAGHQMPHPPKGQESICPWWDQGKESGLPLPTSSSSIRTMSIREGWMNEWADSPKTFHLTGEIKIIEFNEI